MNAASKNLTPSDMGRILDILSRKAVQHDEVQAVLGVDSDQLRALIPQLAAENICLEESASEFSLKNTNGYGEATLSWRCNSELLFLPHCNSTNQVAAEMAMNQPDLTLVVADHQTAGRGRMGRGWDAEQGQNILMSLILRPELSPDRLARCALILAAEIADELDLSLKWPNDLLNAQGQKVAGVLCETREVDGRTILIFGLGLNVNQCEFKNLPQAASLRGSEDSPELDRAELVGRLAKRLLGSDLNQSLDLWRRRSGMLGQMVEVAGRRGIAESVRDDGALIVDGEAVLAGDVFLLTQV